MFRFGASWAPGCQHSPCAPSFDHALPAGSHIVGFCGERSGGLVSRLGVIYAPPPPPGAPAFEAAPRPYKAEHDAVSLTFFRRFYEALVKPRDDIAEAEAAKTAGAKPKLTTTDEVAKELIMAASWDAEMGRALRFVETMADADRWGGPDSQQEAFFVSHGAPLQPFPSAPLYPRSKA